MIMKECSMKKIIFALLCVCLLAAASAVFADAGVLLFVLST